MDKCCEEKEQRTSAMDLKVVLTASEDWANGCVIQSIQGGDEGVSTLGPGTGAGDKVAR